MFVVNKVVKKLLIDCYNETEEIYSKCPLRCDNKCQFFADCTDEQTEDQYLTIENINTLKEILINKKKSIALINLKSNNIRIKTAAYKLIFNSKCIQEKMLAIEDHIMYNGRKDYPVNLLLTLSVFEIKRICLCDSEYERIERVEKALKDTSRNWKILCLHYKTTNCNWQEGEFCCISDSPGTAQKESEMLREILIEKHKGTALFCLDHKPYNVDMAAKYILGLPYCELPNKPLTSNLP